MYLALGSRPDITNAVNYVSRYVENPNQNDVAVKRIFKYLAGTVEVGIQYSRDVKGQMICYPDADFAGDTRSRHSTSGYVVLLSSGPVSWFSQKQRTVALSTTESEYVAACEGVKEMVWLIRMYNDIMGENVKPLLLMDNQSAIRLVKNPEFHKRTKHIDVKFNFIREKFLQNVFELNYVPSELQLADILTKPLPKNKFNSLKKGIGIF